MHDSLFRDESRCDDVDIAQSVISACSASSHSSSCFIRIRRGVDKAEIQAAYFSSTRHKMSEPAVRYAQMHFADEGDHGVSMA